MRDSAGLAPDFAELPAITAEGSTGPASGTETMTGQVTGAAAVANTTTFPLVLTGPVNTTGTITLPNGNSTHATITFKTKAGGRDTWTYNPRRVPSRLIM